MERPRMSEELIITSSRLALVHVRAHASVFQAFGFDEAHLNTFEGKVNDAAALAGNMQNTIDLMLLTSTKDQMLEACFEWGRTLRLRMELAFGKSSVEMRAFPSKAFQNARHSEAAMMPVMEVMLRLVTQHQTVLTAKGQPASTAADGAALLQQLREADLQQETKKGAKKSATEERHFKFTELYDEVNRICRIGKLAFQNEPAIAVLFESPWPRHEAPKPVTE